MKSPYAIELALFGQNASDPLNALPNILIRTVAFDRNIAVEIALLHVVQYFADIVRIDAAADRYGRHTDAGLFAA